jgi:hypothetical protein
MKIRLNSIVLPNGMTSDAGKSPAAFKVTVFLGPRVIEGDPCLLDAAELEGFHEWPKTSTGLDFEFLLDGRSIGRFPVTSPATPVELRSSLWSVFFNSKTGVAPIRTAPSDARYMRFGQDNPPTHANVDAEVGKNVHTVESLSLSTLNSKIFEVYQKIAGRMNPNSGAGRSDWDDFKEISKTNYLILERFSNFGRVSGELSKLSQEPAKDPAPTAPVSAAKTDGGSAPTGVKPEQQKLEDSQEFHTRLASLGDYPQVMRLLGLLVDFEITLKPGEKSESFNLACKVTHPKYSEKMEAVYPYTACAFKPSLSSPERRFRAAQNADANQRGADGLSNLENGLLVLDDHSVIQVDALGLGIQSYNACVSDNDPQDDPRIPSVRTAGISLVKGKIKNRPRTDESRAEQIVKRLNNYSQAPDKLNTISGDKTGRRVDTLLYAEDLVKGFAIDILEARQGQPKTWKSLCLRQGSLTGNNLKLPDRDRVERFLPLTLPDHEAPTSIGPTRAAQPVTGVILAIYRRSSPIKIRGGNSEIMTVMVLSTGGVVWVQKYGVDQKSWKDLHPGAYCSFSGTLRTDNFIEWMPIGVPNLNKGFDVWLEADEVSELYEGVAGCLMKYNEAETTLLIATEEGLPDSRLDRQGWLRLTSTKKASNIHEVYYNLKEPLGQDAAAMMPGGLFVAWGDQCVFQERANFLTSLIGTFDSFHPVDSTMRVIMGKCPAPISVIIPPGHDLTNLKKGQTVLFTFDEAPASLGGVVAKSFTVMDVELTDVRIWDLDTGAKTVTFRDHGGKKVCDLSPDVHLNEPGANEFNGNQGKPPSLDWLKAQLPTNQKVSAIGWRSGDKTIIWRIHRTANAIPASYLAFIHDVRIDEKTYTISGLDTAPQEIEVAVAAGAENNSMVGGAAHFRSTLPLNSFAWVNWDSSLENNDHQVKSLIPMPPGDTITVFGTVSRVSDTADYFLQTAFGRVPLGQIDQADSDSPPELLLTAGQYLQMKLKADGRGIKIVAGTTVCAGYCNSVVEDDSGAFRLREIGRHIDRVFRMGPSAGGPVKIGRIYKAIVDFDASLTLTQVKLSPLNWYGQVTQLGEQISVVPGALEDSCAPFINSCISQRVFFSDKTVSPGLLVGTVFKLGEQVKLAAKQAFCTPNSFQGKLISIVYSPDLASNDKTPPLGTIVRWVGGAGKSSEDLQLYDFFVPTEEFDFSSWKLEDEVKIDLAVPSDHWLTANPTTAPKANYTELPASEQWVVTESYFHWQGWSLAVPRPGKSHWEELDPQTGAVTKSLWKNVEEIAQLQAERAELPLTPKFRVGNQKQPRLRFGSFYRVRMRAIDLAGNYSSVHAYESADEDLSRYEIALTEPDGTTPAPYRRFEPISAPVPMLASQGRPVVDEDQSAAHATVQTEFHILSRVDNGDHCIDEEVSDFFLFPPEIPFAMAEWHGMFDSDSRETSHPDIANPKRSYRLLKEIDSRKKQLTKGRKFLFDPKSGFLPYLPDPLSRGVALKFVRHPFLGDGPVLFHPSSDHSHKQKGLFGSRPWPGVGPVRIRLERGNGEPHWDREDSNLLHVPLAAGHTIELQVSSLLFERDLGLMGIFQIAAKSPAPNLDLQNFALTGQHPMLTPARTIRLVHGLNQPLSPAEFGELVSDTRQFGSMTQDLSATLVYEPMSTGDVGVMATWNHFEDNVRDAFPCVPDYEILDKFDPLLETDSPTWAEILAVLDSDRATGVDLEKHPESLILYQVALLKAAREASIGYLVAVLKSLYKDKERRAVVTHRALEQPGEWNEASKSAPKTANYSSANSWRDVCAGGIIRWIAKTKLHFSQLFPDTRYYSAHYTPQASTSFGKYFPKVSDRRRLNGTPHRIDVFNSSPPDRPSIAYMIPIFKWDSAIPRDFLDRSSTRHGGGIRIYLNRPWYSSGEGEKIGIVLPPADVTEVPAELKPYVSEWGYDPIRNGPPTNMPRKYLPLKGNQLSRVVSIEQWSVSGASQDLALRKLPVAVHDVRFSPTRGLWYCDVVINELGNFLPFVKLAVVRCQPNSVEGAHASTPAIAHFMQLPPTRKFSIKTDLMDSRSFNVSLEGPFPPRNTSLKHGVKVIMECQQASNPDDLTWHAVKVRGNDSNQLVDQVDLTYKEEGSGPIFEAKIQFDPHGGISASPPLPDWRKPGFNPVDLYSGRYCLTVIETTTFESDNGFQEMILYAERIMLPELEGRV